MRNNARKEPEKVKCAFYFPTINSCIPFKVCAKMFVAQRFSYKCCEFAQL